MVIKKQVYITGRYDTSKIIEKVKKTDQLNWEVTNSPAKADYFICFDSTIKFPIFKHTKYILIRNEPSIVLPGNYKPKSLKNFDLIIDIGKIKTLNNTTLRHPQNLKAIIKNKTARSKRLVIVNSNLFSLRSGELYSLRRRAILKLEFIDLYGYGWDRKLLEKIKVLVIEVYGILKSPTKINVVGLTSYFKKMPRYKGIALSKYKTLSDYKYALVIENSFEYFSEKLFDALIAGCIPIYVGINLSEFLIPENLYVKAGPSSSSIAEAYEKVKEMDYDLWKNLLLNWLNDKDTQEMWDEEFYVTNIKKIIEYFYQ